MSEAPTTNQPEVTAPAPAPAKKKKAKKPSPHGQVHILASFNNTIITVTDNNGHVLTSASAGSAGFRGSKKGTAFAGQMAAEKALTSAASGFGLKKADVFVSGIGLGREAALRTLSNTPIMIESVRDRTPAPHGGVRPRKARRV